MIDRLRTLSARFVTRYLPGPRVLLVRAWAWLCASTGDPAEKCQCLEAILALDPDLEWARLALRKDKIDLESFQPSLTQAALASSGSVPRSQAMSGRFPSRQARSRPDLPLLANELSQCLVARELATARLT